MEAPPGFGLRQSCGAFRQSDSRAGFLGRPAGRERKAAESCRSPSQVPFYFFSARTETPIIRPLYEPDSNALVAPGDCKSCYVGSFFSNPRGRRHVAVQQSAAQTTQGKIRI